MANKMTTCKACGAEIAASAKACPNCGAKNKKPIYKRPWFIILAIVVILGIGGAAIGGGGDDGQPATSEPAASDEASSGSGDETKAKEKKIEYEEISADQLSEDLESNAAAAKDKYDGNYYAISGKLGNIDSDGAYIDIDTSDEWDFTNIQCYIQNDKQLDKVKNMSKGDAITVKGKVTDVGELLGYSIDIDSIE